MNLSETLTSKDERIRVTKGKAVCDIEGRIIAKIQLNAADLKD